MKKRIKREKEELQCLHAFTDFTVSMGFTGKQLRSVSNFTLNRFLIFVCQQMIWLMLLPHLVTGNCYHYFNLSNVTA